MRIIEDNYTPKEIEFECCECKSKIGVEIDDVAATGCASYEVYWICPLCKYKNFADTRDWYGYDY